MDQNGHTVSIEPYAPNVLRGTISTIPAEAASVPGYGFIAKIDQAGWQHTTDDHGAAA